VNQVNIFPDVQRADYDRALNNLAKAFGFFTGGMPDTDRFAATYKVFPSQVKMAAQLSPTISSYQFSPRKGVLNTNTPTPVNTEIKLDQNDFFVVTGVAVRFGRADYASTSGAYTNSGNYPLVSYPDAVYFSGAPSGAKMEWQALQTIVNGTLSLTVTGDQLLDSVSIQEMVAKFTTGYNATGPVLPEWNPGPEGKGYLNLTPQLILDASADNSVFVNLAPGDITGIDGSKDSSGVATAYRNLLWVVFTGYKIKNAANGGVTLQNCRV